MGIIAEASKAKLKSDDSAAVLIIAGDSGLTHYSRWLTVQEAARLQREIRDSILEYRRRHPLRRWWL